ncbi:SCO1860 family LAETG-anchored protein [Actinacidiphila glaucinigra]|uniref:LPXTG-motif cell wall anchor domain-containing protein n=1 Tax=Actinacidiphila glaucinigra TaxID=235986 RepID=A0A239A1G2_9ACTN|nr:SCO1860 family LAETG-anchored protein [Actinacidiphila glaucinigra]SNR89497.1 LPXTG-motif cell wall anchor domain-containing protein [Actinacidiphila glaucinigra]
MPARRPAAALGAAVALAAGALALGPATPAAATGGTHGSSGKAGAVVLRTGLDVSLLRKSVDVPLNLTLNEVHAPASADETALTATLDGVDRGRPFSVLRAEVATARATADRRKAEGYAKLVKARVNLPGLPFLGLVKADLISARATCVAGRKPVADVEMPGHVVVLGKRVAVSAGGTTLVKVPGVGEVRLDLAKKTVTSRSAAATALELSVEVNPLKLGVAEVSGTVTLAGATCETPRRGGHGGGGGHHGGGGNGGGDNGGDGGEESGGGEEPQTGGGSEQPSQSAEPTPSAGPSESARADQSPQAAPAATGDLAETGSSSMTPYLAGGSVLLFAAGFLVIRKTRRKPAAESARD